MNPLHTLETIGDRLGWVLVHSVWQFLLIAWVAVALMRVLRGAPATLRYAMLLVALAAMAMMPVATWMILSPASAVAATGLGLNPEVVGGTAAEVAESDGNILSVLTPAGHTQASVADRKETRSDPDAASEAATPVGTESVGWSRIEDRLRPWLPAFVLVWCVGVLAFSLRPLLGWLTLRRLRRVGVSAVPEPIQTLLARAAQRLQVRRRVQLLQSTLVPTPLVIGGVRPIILLPVSVVTGISPAGLEAILIHELAHLRRHDYIVNLLQTLIETAFFYHPAVWWLSHQIRCERENCCDDLAVATLGSPIEYGRALLALEEHRGATTVMAMGAAGGSLVARIRRLQGRSCCNATWQTATTAAVAALPALMLAMGIWSIVNSAEREAAAPAVAAMSQDEQEAWDALEATDVAVHGAAFDRQHLKRHLASLERINFPEPHRKKIRNQIASPIRSADLWRVPAEAWPLIARLESLHELSIVASDLSGEAMEQIARMPNLQRLRVSNSECLPSDAVALKTARWLEQIDMTFTIFEQSPEQRQQWLGELSEAEQAWADAYRMRSGGRQHIIEAAILTDRMLEELRDLPNLKSLRLVNTSISPRAMEAIAVHVGLEELDVSLGDFTAEAILAIGRLTSLRKFRSANVSDETLAAFAGLTKLEELELWAAGVTDAGAKQLLPLRSLRNLALRGSLISDEGLLDLATLPTLERLDLRHAKGTLTADGLAEFRRLNPQCRVILDGDEDAAPQEEEKPQTPATASAAGSAGDVQGTAVNAPSGAAVDQPILHLKRRWVDGENDQPIEGLRILVRHSGGSPSRVLTTDADGLVEVLVPKGAAVSLQVASPGWWMHGMAVAGELNANLQDLANGSAGARAPETTATHKLWRGTIVTGRLLLPNGESAADVALKAGVYINNQERKKRLEMDLTHYSWDHGQWPNWTAAVVTDKDGRFETTVPPPAARSWIRIQTTEAAAFAPAEWEVDANVAVSSQRDDRREFGDLQLERGVRLLGRVLDAEGNPLAGVTLHTSGKRGPYEGRSAVSGEDGRFEFLPMQPGSFTIRPDARPRDETGKVISRDVVAVFLPQPVTLADTDEPVEISIEAVPHVALEFEWIDRRADKGSLAYYGTFPVTGNVPTQDGATVSWRAETERITRDGQEILFVKVPRSLQNPIITLPSDSVVTASYKDDQRTLGPGRIDLNDLTSPQRRIIYGDEPKTR